MVVKALLDGMRKFSKSFNVVALYEELVGIKEQLANAFMVLVAGVFLSYAADFFGFWHLFHLHVSFLVNVPFMPIDIREYVVSLQPFFFLSMLARDMFASRSPRLQKKDDTYLTYLWRYIKAVFLIAAVFVPCYLLAQTALGFQTAFLHRLSGAPFGLLYCLYFCFALALSLFFAVLALWACRWLLVLITYWFAFIMQGKGPREALQRASKIFASHWAYALGLIALLMGGSWLVGYVFEYLLRAAPNSLLGACDNLLSSSLLLLYCALFFSYHKRVSKVPTSR